MDMEFIESFGLDTTKIVDMGCRKVYVGLKVYEDVVFMQIAADFDLDMLDRYIEKEYVKEIKFSEIKYDDGLIFVDEYRDNGEFKREIVRDNDGLYYFLAMSEPYLNAEYEWSIDTI